MRTRKDGTHLAVSIYGFLVDLGEAGYGVMAIYQDIAERVNTRIELEKAKIEYQLLFETMQEGFSLHEIILDEDGKPCNYRFLDVNEAFEAETNLKREDVIGKTALELFPNLEPFWIETYGKVAITGNAIHFENYSRDLQRWFRVHAFSSKKGQFATLLSDVTERVTVNELQIELKNALRLTSVDTAAMLAQVVDEKDEYTAGHCRRIADHSIQLGQKLGLHEQKLDQLRLAALLHDVGKISISENILEKPSALNEDEWCEMKKHPIIGAELVQRIHGLKPASRIIHQHHENWDGTGYPDGIIGHSILLGARILRVVDAYDAMTTRRPYREALSKDAAINQLEQNSGKEFDPDIVKAFLELLETEQ